MKTILIPLDGSEVAERALPLCQRVAEPGDSVLLLTVEEFLPAPRDPRRLDPMLEGRMQALDKHCKALGKLNINAQAVLRYGDPAENIVAYAKEARVQSILMSSHGRTGLARVMYGSVALKVLSGFDGEVIVVRPPKAVLKG